MLGRRGASTGPCARPSGFGGARRLARSGPWTALARKPCRDRHPAGSCSWRFLPRQLLQAFFKRKLKIDDNVNDLPAWQSRPFLAELGQMNPTTTETDPPPAPPG